MFLVALALALLEELQALIARDPALYARLAASPTSPSPADVRELYQRGQEASARIEQADPDDPSIQQVRALIEQLRGYVRRAARIARLRLRGVGTAVDVLGAPGE